MPYSLEIRNIKATSPRSSLSRVGHYRKYRSDNSRMRVANFLLSLPLENVVQIGEDGWDSGEVRFV